MNEEVPIEIPRTTKWRRMLGQNQSFDEEGIDQLAPLSDTENEINDDRCSVSSTSADEQNDQRSTPSTSDDELSLINNVVPGSEASDLTPLADWSDLEDEEAATNGFVEENDPEYEVCSASLMASSINLCL
jgi:hypothetical protein